VEKCVAADNDILRVFLLYNDRDNCALAVRFMRLRSKLSRRSLKRITIQELVCGKKNQVHSDIKHVLEVPYIKEIRIIKTLWDLQRYTMLLHITNVCALFLPPWGHEGHEKATGLNILPYFSFKL
jgi:hypothetical protein